MATQSEAEKLAYVMMVFKNTEMPKPDYHAVAMEAGITNANNAQKRFRAIVKGAGFDLVDGRVVGGDGAAPTATDAATTPAKKPRARKTNGETPKKKTDTKKLGPNKKRKLSPPTVEDASDEDDKPVKQEEVDDEAKAEQEEVDDEAKAEQEEVDDEAKAEQNGETGGEEE